MEKETEDTIKEFVDWIKVKTRLHIHKPSNPYFKEREIWWASLGCNVGFELKGKGESFSRPIIILRKLSADTCLIVPLTTSTRRKNSICLGEIIKEEEKKDSYALLEQIRLIDRKRLEEKEGMLEKSLFSNLKSEVSGLINDVSK